MSSALVVPPRPGLLSRLKAGLATMGIGPWTSRPGPIDGDAVLTDSGWIGCDWGWNYGQRGWDPNPGGLNSVVYACCSLYARTIAQLPGTHKRRREDNGTDRIETSALSRVLKMPNAAQTRSDLMFNLVMSLLVEGNAYAVAIRNERNEVDALYLMPPRSCRGFVSDDGSVFYSIGGNPLVDFASDPEFNRGGRWVVPARDVLHVRVYTPRDPLKGESPIMAAGVPIMTNNTASSNMAAFYANMSRPSGVLSTELTLTAEQTKALRERWNEQSRGLATGGVPILSNGLKWVPLSMSAQDSQIIENLKFSVQDIARVFGIPLALINEMTGATWNNVEALMSAWLSQGLGFYLEHIELSFDKLFGIERSMDYTEFEVDSLLRPDFRARIEGLARGVQGGIYAPNEARKLEGLPRAKDGDMPRVQQQVVPLDWEPPAPSAPKAPAPAAANDDEPDEGDDEADKASAKDMTAFILSRAAEIARTV